MKYIYFLIIRPIELILGFLFKTYVALTGNYGLSVILLSLSVTIIMFPLFYIAEVWKRREQAVEKRMKRRLDYIKKYYTGQKRYCLTKATHRLEGYTAASSFRTSFGLLIQIPFFFAAYHLLSHYEPCRGTGWLFIKDFAAPDGLLWGVNLLPIAMTLINVVSSSIYMRGSRAKEIVELYVMAGVFLLLLYSSPAVLVLYWTMNNIFSIGKSLIFLRLFPHEKYVPDPEEKRIKESLSEWKSEIVGCITPQLCIFVGVTCLFALQCWQITFNKETFEKLFLLTSAIAFLTVVVSFLRWLKFFRHGKGNWSEFIQIAVAGAVYLAVSLLGFYFKLDHADGGLLRKLVLLATFLADVLIYLALSYVFRSRIKGHLSGQSKDFRSLYFLGVAFTSCFMTILSPLLVFLSSPAETGITVGYILASNLPVLMCLIVVSILIWKFSKEKGTLTVVSVGIVLALLLYQYILPGNYGQLDRTLLGQGENLKTTPVLYYFRDILLLCLCGCAAKIIVKKYASVCKSCIAIFLACLSLFAGVKSIKYAAGEKPVTYVVAESSGLPADNAVLNGYSRDGKNVVLFIADMFSGGYMERILSECPEYKAKLNGFTWYRNMLAASTETAISMPSIFAGKDYLPLEMNNMSGIGDDKVRKSAHVLFNQARSKGYEISVVNGNQCYLYDNDLDGIANADVDDFCRYWETKNGIATESVKKINQAHLLTMLSIFQSSPYFLKPVIYNDGGWLIFSKNALFWYIKEHVYPEYAFLDLLPAISNSTVKGNTFKYFHSCLTHLPYGIGKAGNIVDLNSEYPDEKLKSYVYGESAYYSAKKFIALFINWLDWLKENGIFDNTYIILASDHGNSYSENNPLTPDKIEKVLSKSGFNRFNSLLMIKPAGEDGNFKIDDTFIGGGDVNAFVQEAFGNGKATFDNHTLYTVEPQADSAVSRANFRNSEKATYRVFEVKESIFKAENWRRR